MRSSNFHVCPTFLELSFGRCRSRADVLPTADHRQRLKFSAKILGKILVSDHCPIGLSQGSKTVIECRLCRSISISYGFVSHCHGRGRGFESRRPRHSFQALGGSASFRVGPKKHKIGVYKGRPALKPFDLHVRVARPTIQRSKEACLCRMEVSRRSAGSADPLLCSGRAGVGHCGLLEERELRG
jgi:hypothetical protein